jgi:hypothetical protein
MPTSARPWKQADVRGDPGRLLGVVGERRRHVDSFAATAFRNASGMALEISSA